MKLVTCNNLMLKITTRGLYSFTPVTHLHGLLVMRTDSSVLLTHEQDSDLSSGGVGQVILSDIYDQ